MLSLSKVSNLRQAINYYANLKRYYLGSAQPSEWWGGACTNLGVKGAVKANDFQRLLQGKMPDGTRLQAGAGGSRRLATDLTFSAPKSVSLQALVGGDERLIEAHQNAVRETLRYAQDNLAGLRTTTHEILRLKQTGSLAVATFLEETSRDLDPHLHTHCVMMNLTQDTGGRWRALNQTPFYQQQKLLGAIYRSELALAVQTLGYEVHQTHVDGRFELAHLNRKAIMAFSKRAENMIKELKKTGKLRSDLTARAKELLALSTRKAKLSQSPEALRERWDEEVRLLGITFTQSHQGRCPDQIAQQEAAQGSVDFALAHLMERQSVLSQHHLLAAAVGWGTGKTGLADIRDTLRQRTHAQQIVVSRGLLTTPEAQQRERELLATEWRARCARTPLLTTRDAGRALLRGRLRLNAGQRDAAMHILTTPHGITGIQGIAGAGKTAMLERVARVCVDAGLQVRGVAPSAVAARELDKVGIAAETVARFVGQDGPGRLSERTLLIIDEAGMVGTTDMLALLRCVEDSGARAVLVGDRHQLKAVAAGMPFGQLQDEGMATVRMAEIVRQRDAVLKEAVALAADREIPASLARLSQSIIELENTETRYIRMVNDYVELSPVERDAALLVSGTHSTRVILNERVRTRLGLQGQGQVVQVLDGKDLTAAQAGTVLGYQIGDLVRPETHYPSLGLRRGDLAEVLDIQGRYITLLRGDQDTVCWQPHIQPQFQAFVLRELELAIGDRVRFTANDHALGVLNGQMGRVVSMDEGGIKVQTDEGKTVTFPLDRPMPLDHGYAITVHAAQGQTCERVLVDADTRSVTANEAQYYVAISRARTSAVLYTDDAGLLPEVMSREDMKSRALDLKPELGDAAGVGW